ncbi:MAG TPA: hypothetical protein VLC09_21410, partial [Polyangiaceae bacterium]|nr:hypothetical protein [Polyangiaceae bacterium]
ASTGGSDSGLRPPIVRGDALVLDFGATYFSVLPGEGGRVDAFGASKATNLLTGSDNHPDFWGSTFWTSPQSEMEWPPPAALDTEPYEGTFEGNRLTLLSGVIDYNPGLLRVTKIFEADPTEAAVHVTYRMSNEGEAEASLAGWEVTRVAGGGLSFFPTGDAAFTPDGTDLPVEQASGVTWYDSTADTNTGVSKKLNADGAEGWLAHVAGDFVFIKVFADLPLAEQANGEGEVEIYAAPAGDGGYVELENQGGYGPIAPGSSKNYEVTWLVRELPGNVTVEVGSASLLEFVRAQL